MKSILSVFILCGIVFNCEKNSDKSTSTVLSENNKTRTSIEGVWELTGYYNYIDNKVSDSFGTYDGLTQVKMYTPTKVMWSKNVPSDSSEWFGYGSYEVNDGELKEILDYGSQMMSKIIEERKAFIYELVLEPNKFTQIELDEDGNRIYSENYKRIE